MAAVGALASDAGDRVVVLGGRRSADLAAESGCVVSSTVPLPLGQPRLAGRNLRAAWKSGEERHVVAWSERAAVAATLLPQELEIEGRVAAVAGPKPWIEPWLRNRIRIRPIGPDVGAVLARRGWRTGSVIPIEDLARPAEHELSRRNQLRRAWGAEPDELVVGCVADPPGSLDLVLAYNSLVVCRVSGRKVRLVAHPGSGRSAAARQWARGLDVHGPPLATPLIVDERLEAPWQVADGVDLLLMLSSEHRTNLDSPPSTLPLAWWFAAGVPVVASRTRGLSEVLRDGVDGRLVDVGDRNAASSVLMRICDQPELLASNANAAAARWHAVASTGGI